MSTRENNHEQTTERAARMRAARAYAGFPQRQLAQALDTSVPTIRRMEHGTKSLSVADLVRVGEVCGVPRAFMLEGFAAIEPDVKELLAGFEQVQKRIVEAERQIVELRERLNAEEIELSRPQPPSPERALP